MSEDPEVERTLVRAAPLSHIMIEGLWFQMNRPRLQASSPVALLRSMSDWIERLLPPIDNILQNPEAFAGVIERNKTADPDRGNLSLVFSPMRDDELERMESVFKDFRLVVSDWTDSPVENWSSLERGLEGLLQALHWFDPHRVEYYTAWMRAPSRKPDTLRP
jgi:hypothetical protein